MIVISNKSGQLANRMFVFSHLMAFSLEHGTAIYNPSFDEYAEYFEGSKKGLMIQNSKIHHFFDRSVFLRNFVFRVFRKLSRILPDIPIIKRFFQLIKLKNDEELFTLDTAQNIELLNSRYVTFLSGWLFRCREINSDHLGFIRDYFQPVSEHAENINRNMSDIRKHFKTVIGIHIRRGDYETFQSGKYFYEIEQYRKIMLNIADLFKDEDPAFLICSNENIDTGVFKGLNVFKGPGHFVEDLYSLAKCDFIAGPPSTFSMWASFYGNKPLYMIEDPEKGISKESFKIIQL
jgi:hypothetical protein